MSRLTDLDIGARAVIKDIVANEEFKNRLRDFGIRKNSQITLKGYGFLKKVVKIETDSNTCVALRKEEADKVLVERESF